MTASSQLASAQMSDFASHQSALAERNLASEFLSQSTQANDSASLQGTEASAKPAPTLGLEMPSMVAPVPSQKNAGLQRTSVAQDMASKSEFRQMCLAKFEELRRNNDPELRMRSNPLIWKKREMAPPPRIPHPFDDGTGDMDCHRPRKRQSSSSHSRVRTPDSDPAHGSTRDSFPEADSLADREPSPFPSTLDKLPFEVRFMVFKEVLTVDRHIIVYSGWTMLYKRQDLPILEDLGILLTCRRFYSEAMGILYGHNTFLYRLRDATPRLTDVNQVAELDEDVDALPDVRSRDPGTQQEEEYPDDDLRSDSGSEYAESSYSEGEAAAAAFPDNQEKRINIEKHRHLFRHIIVEAERNRFTPSKKKLMASVIHVFDKQKHPLLGIHAMTNIHTLTIRVAPDWDAFGGDEGLGRFTFVDFFFPGSSVVQAIQGVNCQFLEVILKTRCMGYVPGPQKANACKLTMDMRQMCILKRIELTGEDGWKRDRVMQCRRAKNVGVVSNALAVLGDHVKSFCETFKAQNSWDPDTWDEADFDE